MISSWTKAGNSARNNVCASKRLRSTGSRNISPQSPPQTMCGYNQFRVRPGAIATPSDRFTPITPNCQVIRQLISPPHEPPPHQTQTKKKREEQLTPSYLPHTHQTKKQRDEQLTPSSRRPSHHNIYLAIFSCSIRLNASCTFVRPSSMPGWN